MNSDEGQVNSRLGEQLRQMRIQAGMTHEQLAERAAVSVHTIRRIENGEDVGSKSGALRLLADALGLSPEQADQLVAGTLGIPDGGPRVRDVSPEALLAYGPAASYLPRDVDRELDQVLASPGMVLLVYDSNAGARRTAYEAMRRTLPDAVLLVDPDLGGLLHDDSTADVVIWLDRTLSPEKFGRADLAALAAWMRGPARRWGLAIVRDDVLRSNDGRALEKLKPRVVRMSGVLSDREQQALRQLFPHAADVRTVAALAEFVEQGIESRATRSGTRHAADYQADTDEGADRLGVTADVHMLADLVATRLVEPPLSIGLFGDWGSGKSFFMRLMRERIRSLADAAREAETAAGRRGRSVSSYCSAIRQVTFNAWHYTESNLWARLAAHIFDHLAAGSSESDLQRRADDLAESRQAEQSLLGQLSAVRMERMLLTAQQEQRAARGRRPGAMAKTLLRSLSREDKAWMAAELGVEELTFESIQRLADEAASLSVDLKGLWQWLRRDPWPGLVLLGGVALVGVLGAVVGWTGWSGLAGGVAVVGACATAVVRVRAAVTRIRAVVSKLDAHDWKAAETTRRLAELDGEAERLEQAIAELAPGNHIAAFVDARRGSQDYRRHLGVISLLRRDLETFAAMLARDRELPGGGAGIERIVLYIDDLDRCAPKVVVQVLEAIHLMLALPVFTVVVGVDARWLARAIRHHYAAMLEGTLDRDAAGEVLAAQYLEKIFQIPLVVRPMGEDAFVDFVRALATKGEAESLSVPQDRGDPEREAPGDPVAETPPAPEPADRPGTGTAPAVPGSEPPMDLLPGRLAISWAEFAFMATLGPLVPTPRAAKRLVNLYRLFRARFQGPALDEFVDDGSPEPPHRAVLLLLAVMVGDHRVARELFRALADADPGSSLRDVLDECGDPLLRDRLTAVHAAGSGLVPPGFAGSYQRWLPLVRRFSFPAA